VGLEIGARGFVTVVFDHPSQVWLERIVGEPGLPGRGDRTPEERSLHRPQPHNTIERAAQAPYPELSRVGS